MDFGLTDDQREIQRTARELLADRARPERVREHAEARHERPGAVARAVRARLAGNRNRQSDYGGQGLGRIELSILCEELGRTVAPVPFLPSAMAATRDRARRLG